jgi:hypothetical protein
MHSPLDDVPLFFVTPPLPCVPVLGDRLTFIMVDMATPANIIDTSSQTFIHHIRI